MLATLKASKLDCPFSWGAAGQKYGLTATIIYGGFNTIKAALFDEIVNKGRSVLIDLGPHTVAANGFSGVLTTYPNPDGGYSPDTTTITPSMIKVNDPGSSTRYTLADTFAAYSGNDVDKIVKSQGSLFRNG